MPGLALNLSVMKTQRLLSLLTATSLVPLAAAANFFNAGVASAQICSEQSIQSVTGGTGKTAKSMALSSDVIGLFAGSSRDPERAKAAKDISTAMKQPTAVARQLELSGPTRSLRFLTGPSSPDRTDYHWGITSTDLGVAYLNPADGKTYLAFGDTGSCRSAEDDGWRSNVLVRTGDRNFGDGLHLEEALTGRGWSGSGTARQFIDSMKQDGVEMTTIPTAGIVVNGVHYVDYMSVRKWHQAGHWDTNYATTMRSTDGVHWSPVAESTRENLNPSYDVISPGRSGHQPGYENLQMAAFVEKDNYVYRLSTPNGRFDAAFLSRAPKDQFPAEDAFEYWSGSEWSNSPGVLVNSAAAVIDGPVSELSVAFSTYLNKYVALYLMEGTGLVMRTADSLTGPWSAQRVLVDTHTVPDLYGGFILPKQDDQHLYYVATTWSDYNVYFMRTDLDYVGQNTTVDDNITVDRVLEIPVY